MSFKVLLGAMTLVLGASMAQAKEAEPVSYTMVAEQPGDAREREIAGLFERWNETLKTGDSKKVAQLYAPNAVLLPTLSNQVRTTPEQIADYFDHFLAARPIGLINHREVRRLGDHVATDSGVYTFTLADTEGKTRDVQARYTFVYEHVNGQWKILSHHSSGMPQASVK